MTMNKRYFGVVFFLLASALLAMPAAAMINPAAGYCTGLGYPYTDTVGKDGSMTGYCVLPGNQSVDAWQFLQGKISPELSYCKKQGLEIRTVSDPKICGMLGSTCAVCVKADGTLQEVTNMMNLDFREKICNEKICCDPAIDKSCAIGSEPTDWSLIMLIAVIIVLMIAGAYFLMKKKKGPEPEKKNV